MIYNTNPDVTNSPLVAWDNLIDTGTLTASSSLAGFPVDGLLNGVTTDPWRPNAMPATVTLAMPDVAPASVVAFAAHDMGSKGVTVILERLVSAVWVDAASVEVESDDPFMLSFPVSDAAQWRVRFTGAETFRLAVLHLSKGLTIPGRVVPPHVPLHRVSEVDLVGDSESGTGEFLQADFERTGGRASLNFSVQLPDFAAGDDFEGFRQHFNRGRPFFFASTPTYEPRDMGYLWKGQRSGSILAPYQDAVFMTIGLEASVYVR
jgi:hypothetical protein